MLPKHDESIMISKYPIYEKEYVFEKEKKELDEVIDFIIKVRTLKLENNVPKDAQVYINAPHLEVLTKMLKISDEHRLEEKAKDGIQLVSPNQTYEIVYYFDNSVNKEEELKKLNQEKERLMNSISRREKLLSNPGYLSKAPEAIVKKEREDLEKEKNHLQMVLEKLK